MFNELWIDWAAWWATVMPEFVFLLVLPFAVAGVAFLGDFIRARLRRS